jgi:hypothetical protein
VRIAKIGPIAPAVDIQRDRLRRASGGRRHA